MCETYKKNRIERRRRKTHTTKWRGYSKRKEKHQQWSNIIIKLYQKCSCNNNKIEVDWQYCERAVFLWCVCVIVCICSGWMDVVGLSRLVEAPPFARRRRQYGRPAVHLQCTRRQIRVFVLQLTVQRKAPLALIVGQQRRYFEHFGQRETGLHKALIAVLFCT